MSKFAFALIVLCFIVVDTRADDEFYIAYGQRVPLQISQTSIAVKLDRGQEEAFEEFIGRMRELQVIDLPVLQRDLNIRLLRIVERVSELEREGSFEAVRRSPLVASEIKVYGFGNVELLFIGHFRIRFEDAVKPLEVPEFLRSIDARIVSDRDRDTGRFVVEFPNKSFAQALNLVNSLHREKIVRYAQPDFIRVYPPRLDSVSQYRQSSSNSAQRPESFSAGESCNPHPASTSLSMAPNDTLFGNQWSLRNTGNNPLAGKPNADIKYLKAADYADTPDIKIAIIDFGVDAQHPDLNVVNQYDATLQGDPAPQTPYNCHGTAVAGIAAAIANNFTGITGVASRAQMISIRIGEADCDAKSSWVSVNGSEWRGIQKAVSLGARVLINSWGGGAPDNDIYAEIKDAIAAGRIVVFAAGNHDYFLEPDGAGGYKINPGMNKVSFPANLAEGAPDALVRDALIAVSATNQYDEFKTHKEEVETTVSQDDDIGWGSNRGPAISLAAPGVHLYTTNVGGGYTCFSGTSAAAPLVGGAAAILLQHTSSASPAQVKGWLQEGADKLYLAEMPFNTRDDFIGHGRLDLAGTIEAAAGELDSDAGRRPLAPQDLGL